MTGPDRAKIARAIYAHIVDPHELDDDHVALLNSALIGIKWSRETHDFTLLKLQEIAAHNVKEISCLRDDVNNRLDSPHP